MKKLLVALALLLMWVGASHARNVFIGTNGVASIQPSQCPLSIDNGCAAAAIAQPGSTAATIFLGTSARNPGGALNQLVATTTNYATSGPNQNMPGLEYPAGEVLPVSSLTDPALGGLPSGCSYNATGNVSGGPQVTCSFDTGFNGQSLSGWSFDSNGSHNCVALYITGTAAGSSTMVNDLIRNGTADCAVKRSNTTSASAQLDSDDGLSTVTLTNVSFDGNSLASPSTVWQTYNGGCAASSTVTCNGGTEVWLVNGAFSCDYCSIVNYWARPITYDGNLPMSVTHSYVSGCCMADPTAHSEYLQYASTTTTPGLGTGFTFNGDTIIVTTAHQNIGLAMLPANFGTDTFVDSRTTTNNLILIGFGGGGGITYSVDGPSSTVIGDVFTAGTVTGTANGATGGLLGNGSLAVCNTTGSALSFTLSYAGLSGTTSAGPGGGGFGGTGSEWLMDLNQATITSFIDDGTSYPSPSGVAGNVLSVTADTSMNMLTTNGVSVSGHAVTGPSSITGHPGSGGIGQYVVGGSAAVVGSANVAAVPVNHLHGGWDIPPGVTLTCSNLNSGSAPWTSAISDDFSPGFTQITNMNNYIDLQVYGSDQNYWAQRTGVTQLGGHISGTTLTLDGIGGTVMVNKGTGYSSATVSYTGGTGCSPEPTGTPALFLGTVNSITQVTPGGGCTTVPTATVSAPQGGTFTGSITSNVLTVSTTPTLAVKIVPSTTTLTSVSGNPTVGTQIGGTTGGIGTYNITSANLGSTTITASGVQATATSEFIFGSAFSSSELLTGAGISTNTYVTGGSGLSWTVTPSQTVSTTEFIVPLNTWCFNPTNWGGNVEMSNPSLNTPTIMNNFTSVVAGNGC